MNSFYIDFSFFINTSIILFTLNCLLRCKLIIVNIYSIRLSILKNHLIYIYKLIWILLYSPIVWGELIRASGVGLGFLTTLQRRVV